MPPGSLNKPARLEWLSDLGFGLFTHWPVDSPKGVVISHSLAGADEAYTKRFFTELPTTFGARKYTLNGKATTQKTETFMGQAAVTAKMEGDNFVIATSRPYGGMPGNVTLQISEVWSLSADGKVLTITTRHDSPAVKKLFTQTYNRK